MVVVSLHFNKSQTPPAQSQSLLLTDLRTWLALHLPFPELMKFKFRLDAVSPLINYLCSWCVWVCVCALIPCFFCVCVCVQLIDRDSVTKGCNWHFTVTPSTLEHTHIHTHAPKNPHVPISHYRSPVAVCSLLSRQNETWR